jgi:polar amino acid transport system permease protein
MRVIVPPMGNEVITMLKTTALVSVIAGEDLMTVLQRIYSQNYQVIPLLVVASIWYLALTSLLSIPQAWLERRYGRGHNSARPSVWSRLTGLRSFARAEGSPT